MGGAMCVTGAWGGDRESCGSAALWLWDFEAAAVVARLERRYASWLANSELLRLKLSIVRSSCCMTSTGAEALALACSTS
jgi:hypothetical protein